MKVRHLVILCLSAAPLRAQVVQQPNFNPNVSAPVMQKKVEFQFVAVPPFSIKTFADKLEERLKNRCVGYQFTVSFNDQAVAKRAGGVARQSPDDAPRAMTVDDKYNLASVSKTITAAAVVKLLDAKHVGLDSPMFKFLPDSFQPTPNVKTITFRELLTHHSGIRCGDVDRAGLETCIAAGIKLADKNDFSYSNSNFALFRYLIPELEVFSRGRVTKTSAGTAQVLLSHELRYINYVRKNVLEPAGLTDVACKPTDAKPALCYQFPCPSGNGTDFGDNTQVCGSQGWNLSSAQLATFISALLYTEKILPAPLRDKMKNENLGLYQGGVKSGVISYGHGGFFPGKHEEGNNWNAGELNSLAWGMSNGVSVALIVNSQYGNNRSIGDAVVDTAREMIK